MTDRFKFRCGITISHYDEDENDIETLLLVNNVSIYDDGEVGFDRESLKEAVKKKKLSEEEERTLWNSLDEYEVFEDWYQMPADFIEQCTGLKDKNGKLIYDGDIVSKIDTNALGLIRNRICRVFWHEKWLAWAIETEYGDVYMLHEYDYAQYEVIGNIHENNDLLEG